MKISLLTIGDELLIGQVLNSNVQWMSEQLTDLGCEVVCHLTVGDKESEISGALDFVLEKSEALIIGGGLGPTHDDLTMEALSRYFNIPLKYDQDWISKVENYFKSRNRMMTENNKKQGYLLESATRIDNDCGTAAGQHFIAKNTLVFVVPGVPHEMKSMMTRFILPTLATSVLPTGEKILKESLLTTGLGESLLAERLNPFVQKIKSMPNVSLAFLPSNIQVRLRLQMRSANEKDESTFSALSKELKQLCGADFFGMDPITLEQVVLQKLEAEDKTLALAESCTGGLIAHRLTQIPGSSKFLKGAIVAYRTEIKTLELGILPSLIQNKGVVSEEIAKAMAESIRTKWGADYGLATTGFLGPEGGDSFASVGTVCIAVSGEKGTITRTFQYENHRERSKERAAQSALDLLRRAI